MTIFSFILFLISFYAMFPKDHKGRNAYRNEWIIKDKAGAAVNAEELA